MRWIAEALWMFAAVVAGTVYGPSIAVGGAMPLLPAIIVVRVALSHGPVAGNALGFCGGLLIDVTSLQWFGSTMFVGSLVGYAVGSMRERIVLDSPAARVAVLFIAAMLWSAAVVAVRTIASPTPPPDTYSLSLGRGLYTALAGGAWWAVSGFARAVFGMRSIWRAEG